MQVTQQKTSLLPEVDRVSLGFLPLRFLLKMPPMKKKKNRINELLVTKEGKKGVKKKVILSLILFNS